MEGRSDTLLFMPLLTVPAPTKVLEGTLVTLTVHAGVITDTVIPEDTGLA